MNIKDTGDSLIVETDPAKGPSVAGVTILGSCVHCGVQTALDYENTRRGVFECHHCHRTSMLLTPRRPPNLQRFEPGGRGPCRFCGEAALLDKVTGFCCPCARVWLLGRP